jgi:16S rRNA (cytosine1407-C5)-methyltransferase
MNTTQLPAPFIKKLETFRSFDQIESILRAYSCLKPISIRVNSLRATQSEVEVCIKNTGGMVRWMSWYPQGGSVSGISVDQLTSLPEYQQGLFYIQNLSSMIPPLVLNPQPKTTVLDLAAAPGSKTTQMAALMNNTGTILANDSSRERLFKLRANLERLGVTNVTVQNKPGQLIWQKYPEYFDSVLLDAPCSLEGMFRIDDPDTYTHWSQKKVKSLAKQQKWLLRAAVSAAKPGAHIVYSTCTLSPEENEEVIQWIIEKEKEAVQILPIDLAIAPLEPGLTSWNGTAFTADMKHTRRIYPSPQMEGFFIALLKKTTSTVTYQI